ncbi:Hydroxymethylpyrimidine transporter CytX, partial [Dysosmobacter welbionis]
REAATSAYTAPFFSTVNSILVGCMVFSSTITRTSRAATQPRAIHAPRLLFFSCSIVTPPLHFVGGLLTEQAGGLHHQDDDEQREGERVGKHTPVGALDHRLAETDE